MKNTQHNMETAENANRDLELAMYIWRILKTQMTVIMSWGIDPGQAKVIDLFEIKLLSEERELVKFIDGVYLDCLINTLDENIEKCENYEQRVNDFLREGQIL